MGPPLWGYEWGHYGWDGPPRSLDWGWVEGACGWWNSVGEYGLGILRMGVRTGLPERGHRLGLP